VLLHRGLIEEFQANMTGWQRSVQNSSEDLLDEICEDESTEAFIR
jgi:hypothetical protein